VSTTRSALLGRSEEGPASAGGFSLGARAREVRGFLSHGPRREVGTTSAPSRCPRPRERASLFDDAGYAELIADRGLGRDRRTAAFATSSAAPEPGRLGQRKRGLVVLLEAQLRLRPLFLPAGARPARCGRPGDRRATPLSLSADHAGGARAEAQARRPQASSSRGLSSCWTRRTPVPRSPRRAFGLT